MWIALDDATVDNGCLWVLPGSHRSGVLYPTRTQHDPRFDSAPEAFGFAFAEDDAVPVELAVGDALVCDGHLLHRSFPNRHHTLRRALVNHYMSAESLLPWQPPDGEHKMATADVRDVVLAAGHNPHSYKGVENINRPFVRPDDGPIPRPTAPTLTKHGAQRAGRPSRVSNERD